MIMGIIVEQIDQFKKKYPFTVAWRLKKNATIVEKHLNPDEKVLYAFPAQKSNQPLQIFHTCVVALTNRRILIGRDRVVVGYFLDAITPDMFNDLKVVAGLLWGKVLIDTIREHVVLSHLDKRSLDEIETAITTHMMEEKKKYNSHKNN